jgi:hypothetical protein
MAIFQVLTAASVQMIVVWDVTPCSLLESDPLFRAVLLEAINTSETRVNLLQTTRRNIPEDRRFRVTYVSVRAVTGPRPLVPEITFAVTVPVCCRNVNDRFQVSHKIIGHRLGIHAYR